MTDPVRADDVAAALAELGERVDWTPHGFYLFVPLR